MRSLLLIFCTLFLCITAEIVSAQVYDIDSYNGQTVNTCTGIFYDSNPSGQYSSNENYTVTFCPGTPGTRIKLEFNLMDIAFGDSLVIYDGPNTSSPVLVTYNSTNFAIGSIVAQNSGGCLTVVFRSDAATQANGFRANVKCALPCQPIVGNITSSPAADANGVVTVCTNQPFTLTANVSYPNSGTHYTQRNDLSNFKWRLGFANDTSGINLTSLTETISQAAGYKVRLTVSDSNGCFNTQEILIRVRVPVKPTFNVTTGSICVGDTAILTASATANTGFYIPPPFSGDSLFLPDGTGVTYTDTLKISDFAPGQTLTNINDFLGVFLNMEHSYLGDLEMRLITPNGASITLKQQTGGAATQLGEPNLNDEPPTGTPFPGRGYDYGFTPTATAGTMVQNVNLAPSHNYIGTNGVSYTNKRYLPSGTYNSASNMSAILGSPLNGNWVISIKDQFKIDNGYLFNWYLKFATSLYPNPDQYTIPIQTVQWQPAPTIVNNNGNTIKVLPTTTGALSYTVTANDSFCSFDTTVTVTAVAKPAKPNLGNDIAICPNQNTTLFIFNRDPSYTYTWSTGVTANQLTINQPGLYWVEAKNSSGCTSRDTIIVNPSTSVRIDLGADTMYCASAPYVLQPQLTGTFNNLQWNNGSTASTITINAPGIYWLQGISSEGCILRDSIKFTNNPVNDWTMPDDTTFCGDSITLTIINTLTGAPHPELYTWWDGTIGYTHVITDSGTYKATANFGGCLKTDSTWVDLNKLRVVSLGNDTMYCASAPNVLQSTVSSNAGAVTYLWNNGTTNTTLPITTAGTYWVEVATTEGCKARDSINVSNNPVNNWQMPNDTIICGNSHTIVIPVNITQVLQPNNFTWWDGTSGTTHVVTDSGMYKATANYKGCLKTDSTLVAMNRIPVVSLGTDTMLCAASPFTLQPNVTASTVISYSWSNGAANNSLLITNAGPYWLEVATPLGCKARDSINIADNPVNNWQMPNDTSVCGDNYLLNITNTIFTPAQPSMFTWHDGSTGLSHNITDSGMYKATATYSGCAKTDSTLVEINRLPKVNLGNDTMLCTSAPLTLQPDTTGTIVSYVWSTGYFGFNHPITTPGIYWIDVSTPLACTARDSIIITENPVNDWQMPNDTTICGNSYLINVTNTSPPSNITWFDGSIGLSYNITDSGKYKATANYNGCTKTDSIIVALNKVPVVDLGRDTFFCATSPNVLQAKITGGSTTSYLWSNGATNTSLPITTTGIYWLEVSTAIGCKTRDSIIVDENPINNWQIQNDTSICDRSTYNLVLNNYPSGTAFIWSDGSTASFKSITKADTYRVTANYIGCSKQDSIKVDVRPLPIINIGIDSTICSGLSLPLHASYPGATYVWNTGRTDSAIVASQPGIYWARATLNGCSYTDSMKLSFMDCECNTQIPNAFSPNNDGINDVWKLKTECYPSNYQVSVFNRYGQLVYSSKSHTQGWDGTMNGSKLPVGTYYYIITYYNESLKKQEKFAGNVTILR